MKKTKNKLIALILSLATIISMAGTFSVFGASDTTITATKTAKWTDTAETKAQIEMKESKIKGVTKTPNILFVGTLCSAHSLDKDTLYTSLAATAQYGNVDCYLCGNDWNGGTVERKYHGTINMLTLKRSSYSSDEEFLNAQKSQIKNTEVTFEENESGKTSNKKIGEIELISGQHTCVYDFAELFKEFKDNNKNYDYIVFEFDGLRMGHTDYNAVPADMTNLVAASEWIAPYYTDGKIAWIIPNKTASDDRPKTYTNKYMLNEYWFDNYSTSYYLKDDMPNVRNCIWLLAPEDISATEKSNKIIEGTIEDQKNFIARATDASDKGIWVTYDNSSNVKVFLERKLALYSVEMEDIVAPGFTVKSVVGQYSSDGGQNWTNITANATTGTDAGKFTYTQGTKDATGTKIGATFNITKIFPGYIIGEAHDVRMLINCELDVTDPAKSNYLFTLQNDFTTDTNVGDASITYKELKSEDETKLESPELERDVEFKITYDLKGGSLGTGVTNPAKYKASSDDFTLNNPTKTGYDFAGWTGTDLSAASSTVTVTKGSIGDRAYTATWNEKTATLKYHQNYGSGDTLVGSEETLKYTEAKLVKTETPSTREGYTFLGWSTNANATEADANYAAGKTIKAKNVVPADTDLYAVWAENSAKLTYHKNYGTGDDTFGAVETLLYTQQKQVKDEVPTRSGYIFLGWSTDESATQPDEGYEATAINKAIIKGQNIDPAGDVDLYAVWGDGIGLVKTVDKEKALAGETLSYTVTVKNNTSAAVANVIVADTIPAGLVNYTDTTTDTGIVAAEANATQSNANKSWTITSIAAGASKVISFTAQVPTDAEINHKYKNFAVATHIADEDIPEAKRPKSSTVTTTVLPYTTISVTKAWSDGWDNHSSDTVAVKLYANDVEQSDVIELSSTNKSWSKIVPTFDSENKAIKYEFKELDASGNPVADGVAYGDYTASYSLSDDDTKITNIYQVKPEDLTFTKKINSNKDSIEAKAGSTATYTISITNTKENEGEIAKNLKITDSIPDGLTVQGTPTKTTGTLAKTGNDYTWTIPSLAPMATATLTFTVKIPDGVTAAQYVNKAQLTELYGKTLTTAKDTNETKINVRSFEVSKEWKEQDGTAMSDEVVAKQPAVLVTLKQNGTKYGETKTLNASGNWKYKWEELPLNDASGNAYEYTVEETAITGYTGEVSYTTTDEVYGNIVSKITNTYGPAISKTVDQTTAKSGDTLTYTITLTNTSADDIELYTVEDTLDTNLEFQSAEYGSTTLGKTGEHINGQKLTLAGLTIPKKSGSLDGKLVITITAKVKTLTKDETIKNTAIGIDNKGKKLSSSSPDIPAYPAWNVSYEYVGTAPKAAVKPTDTKDYTEIDNKATVKEQTAVPGWEFSGWYKDAELEDAVAVGDQLTLTGSKKLYGAWTCKIEPSKTVNKTEVKGGEDLTYKIKVKNSSTQEVTGYVISDTLESRLIYKSSALTTDAEAGNIGNPSYDEDSKTVMATDVTIPAGKTVTLEIVATLDPFLEPGKATTDLTNEATVNPNTGDKTLTVKADPVKPVPKAVTIKYEYKKAQDTDPLPDGLSAPADVTSGVKYGDSYKTEARQTAQGWSFEGWYYYDKDNIKTVLEDEDELLLTKGNIKSLEDTNVVTLYGTWTYNVTLSKTVNKTTDVKGGDDIEYTITASNASPTAVTNYKIEDTLDSRLTYKSSKLESTEAGAVAGTVSTDGQKVSATGLKIPAKGSVTLKITATVTAALTEDDAKTKVENTAKGTPNNNDPPKEAPAPPVEIAPRGITINYHYVDTGLGHNPDGATLPEESTKDYGSDYKTQDKSSTALTYDSWYTFSGWYQSYNAETETFSKPVSGTNALTTDNFGTLATSSTIDLYGAWTAVDSYSVSKDVEYNDESIANGEALANSTVAYNITVKNDSPAETRNITVVDKLPEGLSVLATSISDSGVLNPDKDRIIWSLTIGPSETKVLTFNATVPEDIEEPREYKNIAFVNTVEEEPYDGPGSETPKNPSDEGPGEVTFTGVPIVKIGVKKLWSDGWDDHGLVTVGLFKNEGNSPIKTIDLADDSIYTEILPAFEKGITEYSELEYSFREIVGSKAAEDGSVKTITVNDKPADYMVNYFDDEAGEFVVTTITNTYQVGPEDLVVGKAAKNDEIDIKKIEKGDEFSYKITVNNTRTDVGVKDVVVEDNVPEGLEIGTIESDENNIIEVSGQKLTWTVKELEKGATATLIIPVKVIDERDAAEFTNVAKVNEIGGSIVDEPEKPSSNEVKTELRNFTVSKEWYQYNKEKKTTESEPLEDTSEQPAVKVTLMRSVNGGKAIAVGDAVELSESNNWKHKWTKLDMYDADGNLYAYTAKEADIAGHSSSTVYASTGSYGNTSAVVKNLQGSRAVSYEFIAGGGPPIGMTTPPAETVAYAEKYTAADKPSAEGYVFDGWYTEPEAENKFVDGTPITENTILYGKWTPIKYNISYDLEGGELKSGSNPATYTADDPDITLNNPTKEGFKFVGWTGTDLETETLTVVIPHGSIGDRQYKAVWEPLNHDISYDKPKDGPYDPEKPVFTEPTTETYPRYTRLIVDPNAGIWVHDGKTYQAPVEFILDHDINVEKPVREGYVFLGWDRFILDEGLTVKLVAKWTPDQIGTDDPDKSDGVPDIYQKKVTFQIKHGEWEDETIEDIVVVVNLLDEDGNLDPNGSASISIPEGMKPDAGFSPENGAWDEEPELVVSGTDDLVYLYSYNPVYIFRPVEDEEDTTIKVEIGEKIRVNPNGGKWKHLGRTYRRTTTIVIEEDTKIADATRDGYKFMGWSQTLGKDGIVTLTATWKSIATKTGDSTGLNNYLFSGIFALMIAVLLMLKRRNDFFKLETSKPVEAIKTNKSYMGWYDNNEDIAHAKAKRAEAARASEVAKASELPDVIEGKEFVIKIKK